MINEKITKIKTAIIDGDSALATSIANELVADPDSLNEAVEIATETI